METVWRLIGLDMPKCVGEYNILSERIRTMLPVYAIFDGERWTNIPQYFLDEGGKLWFAEKC